MMRRSFGSGGMGGGGNGTGGNGLIRTVHRAVRTGGVSNSNFTKNKNNNLNPNKPLTLSSSSSSFSSLVNLPSSQFVSTVSDDNLVEWEFLETEEDSVFGNVPDVNEVNHALFTLQKVLGSEVTSPTTTANESVESETDWIEPSLHMCYSSALQSRGSDRVYDAFHLLQTEPSVQRMVISLSSDKAVWDAVLNNELVKELRDSIQVDEKVEESETSDESDGDSNPVKDIMIWIFVNARGKIIQLIDNIGKLMSEAFQPGHEEKKGGTSDLFEEKLKTSLFLSIIVLLIVVVARAQSARL